MFNAMRHKFAIIVVLTLLGVQAGAAREAAPIRDNLPGPAPRFDAWQIVGPGGGGSQFIPTVSPHNPGMVVERCDMTGSYITYDGGLSWRMFNLRTVVSAFAFDPWDPKVIYAGNAALWRSEDSGVTWKMVFPDPSSNTVEHMSGDHAEYFLTTDDTAYPQRAWIRSIAVDPGDSRRIYVAADGNSGGCRSTHFLATKDRGKSWVRVKQMIGEGVLAMSLHRTPGEYESTVYIISVKGVYTVLRDNWEFFPCPEGVRFTAATIGMSKEASAPLIYAVESTKWEGNALSGGIYVSTDGGRAWKVVNDTLTRLFYKPGEGKPLSLSPIACSTHNPSNAYTGFSGLRLGPGGENLFSGIAKTEDSGEHWSIVYKASRRPSPNMEEGWISERAPDGTPNIFFDSPEGLGVAPTNPDMCYATDTFTSFKTLDGGKTWQQIYTVNKSQRHWTTRGLDVTTSYGVHFDPFDGKHIFITYTDIGLFQSPDGGQSWMGATEGIPNLWRNTTYWIEFDPAVKGLVWGAFGFNHDLPRSKMWRRTDPHDYQGGVALSTDGGNHWTVSNRGMPETSVTHILMDPQSRVGSRTLYACGFGRGVYKSTDNGKTWSLKNTGIEGAQPFAWRLTRAGDGALYLVIARRSDNGTMGDSGDGALYRSVDGAEHWEKLPLPKDCNGPTGVAVDPADDQRLYLTAWARYSPPDDTGGGVFLSTDGGRSWRNIFGRSQHVYDVTIDTKNPKVLYICGFDSAAYRSADSGQTWARIMGYNFKWGHRVICDPIHRDKVYVTTFGSSVWHGPATGDSNATEDIVVPPFMR